MKLVWIINIMLPQIAEQMSLEPPVGGGWLVKIAEEVSKKADLTVIFPQNIQKTPLRGRVGEITYIGFWESGKNYAKYDKNREKEFSDLLKEIQPDLLHVWGTEFTYALAMIRAFDNYNQTVISIQGLISICADAYMADLPAKAQRKWTFRDLLRADNLKCQQRKFKERGKYEILAMQKTGNFIGRTDWDEAAVQKINPNAAYYKCNEILRELFYQKQGMWSIENIERHSLLLSQGGYPLKGLHKALEAVAQLKTSYPKVKLYIAGSSHSLKESFKAKLRKSSYDQYIIKLIEKYELKDYIVFLGKLSEGKMAEQMLKTHIFISASSMENESNSLSEAKMLGVPSVASFAGGTASRIKQGIDGFQYQYEESYMLAYYIRKIFESDELASRIGKAGALDAKERNSMETNIDRLLEIYGQIYR